jgi:hypothetical protein
MDFEPCTPCAKMDFPSIYLNFRLIQDTKVRGSEPALICGKSVDQRIKDTPGITGLSALRVPIDGRD